MIRERFAPSPSGLLHLGHAYSALYASEAAKAADGAFLLRIEDIDSARVKPEFIEAIYEDLAWLGIAWDEPVLHQSTRMDAYRTALDRLTTLGVTYPCSCNRSDIKLALSALQEGVTFGPDGAVYPGTCRIGVQNSTATTALRLNMARALKLIGENEITYRTADGQLHTIIAADMLTQIGDIVLARKDIGTSYHLSVVVDDAFQGISHVTRGLDLESATPIHRVLQILLELPEPIYRHHDLVRDETGKRLAKRDDARSIRAYREAGMSQQNLRAMLPPMPSA